MGTTGARDGPYGASVTETQTQPLPGAKPPKTRSPEYQLARGALRGLREDLFRAAFAYRPLPRMRTDGPLTRRLPGRIRERAGWAPHAVVVGCALVTLALASDDPGSGALEAVLPGLLPAAAVLMSLVRPVGAWWCTLGATLVLGLVGAGGGGWPWPTSCFFAQLVVMIVAAARTRPRAAAWMWLFTVGLGGLLGRLYADPWESSDTGPVAVVTGIALLVVTVLNVRREARAEVDAERTVSAAERSRRTRLEERTTIARELHDVVAHHMSVVAIQAEAAPYRVENPPAELEQAFATIRENAVAALTELRRVLGVVRAEEYEAPDAPQPTLADLDALLANVRETGLAVEKTVTGAVRELPQGVELSAYRIVQEALSNSLRHAPGAEARVEVAYVLGGLGLRIVNGPATQPAPPSPGAGHGLTGMQERVAMLGGEMTTGPAQDGGYEVAVFLPVAAAGAQGGAADGAGDRE
ncbi:sensor histidine kinase [Streptomyces sp. NPDC002004]